MTKLKAGDRVRFLHDELSVKGEVFAEAGTIVTVGESPVPDEYTDDLVYWWDDNFHFCGMDGIEVERVEDETP